MSEGRVGNLQISYYFFGGKGIFLGSIFLTRGKTHFLKIVINIYWIVKKLHCKWEPVVSKILGYRLKTSCYFFITIMIISKLTDKSYRSHFLGLKTQTIYAKDRKSTKLVPIFHTFIYQKQETILWINSIDLIHPSPNPFLLSESF